MQQLKNPKKREKDEHILRAINLIAQKENKTETDVKNIVEQQKELRLLREKTMEGVLLRSTAT